MRHSSVFSSTGAWAEATFGLGLHVANPNAARTGSQNDFFMRQFTSSGGHPSAAHTFFTELRRKPLSNNAKILFPTLPADLFLLSPSQAPDELRAKEDLRRRQVLRQSYREHVD